MAANETDQKVTPEIGLKIRDGIKVYPGTIALNRVDFDLYMGAVNVLVGENGAGKSTMMKIVAGVEPLTLGSMELWGEQVKFYNKNQAEAAGIGIVFQELNLFPNMTVAENIFIGREEDPRRHRHRPRAPAPRDPQDIKAPRA